MNPTENSWTRAVSLVRQGRAAEALFLFKTLVLDPESAGAAIREIGHLYECGGTGLEVDYSEALRWYRKGYYEYNCADCASALGRMYYHGHGVERDYGKAVEFFSKVDDNDQPEAHLTAGIIWHNGLAGKKDFVEAKRHYMKAASLGNVWALRNLGILQQQSGQYTEGVLNRIRAIFLGSYLAIVNRHDRRLRHGL
jgi:TPR repeat protein